MDRDSALESLRTIRSVIDQTRREVGKDGPYLAWAGGLLIPACLVEQWFWLRQVPGALPHLAVWGCYFAFVLLGALVISRRLGHGREGRIADGLGRRLYAIWAANWVAIAFVVYLALGPKLFKPIHIWALATLLDTLGVFVTGVLLSSRGFIILSVLGLPTVLLMVMHPMWQPMLFGLYIGGGYTLIGLFSAGRWRGGA